MDVTIGLQVHDQYQPVTLGVPAGQCLVFVRSPGSEHEVAVTGTPREFRRLAKALNDAATGPPLGRPKGNGDPRT